MRPPLNTSQDPERIAARMQAVCEMFDVGMSMLRSRLKREMPNATDDDIRRKVAEYLHRDQPIDPTQFHKRTCSRFSAKS
ncbi:MAG: hypothetical protein ACIAXF_10540 [Phycisphaerales bacterium JB063]